MKWASEFKDFIEGEGVKPPGAVQEQVLARARDLLEPSPWKVFSKLTTIHAVTGTATLAVCPQFGIRLAGEGMGLSHYFMGLGDYGCMMACGGFFTAGTALIAALALRPEEIQVIRKNRIAQPLILATLSLATLACFGGAFIWSLAATWLLASAVTSAGLLELCWRARRLSI